MICPACTGHWQERFGCVRCDDGARDPHEEAPEPRAPEPLPEERDRCVWRALTYYLERALRTARPVATRDDLRRLIPPWTERLARSEDADRACTYLVERLHVSPEAAPVVVAAYAAAAREQGRAYRLRAREWHDGYETKARRCEEHAARIEMRLLRVERAA